MDRRGPWDVTEESFHRRPARAQRPEFRPPARRRKVAGSLALVLLVVLAAAAGSLGGVLLIYSVDLPQISELEHYRPMSTTEIYDRNGQLIGSFALQRRTVVRYQDFAPVLRDAIISIEDKNFESHWGVNLFRIAGAAYHDMVSHTRSQGASTLTMQLARNLFLSDRRTFSRKLQEVLLTLQMEHTLTKQQIFTLYANQIYLGSGVYGFEAGAEFYFSKHASQLTLPEAALLAALPKGPEEYSPIRNPTRAFERRNLVIDEMLEDGKITDAQANAARNAPLGLHLAPPPNSVAPWFVENVREELDRRFGTQRVHEAGLKVYTTLDLNLQKVANQAVLTGLEAYEQRHGWRGHLLNVLDADLNPETFWHPDWSNPAVPGAWMHAVVTDVEPYQVTARIAKRTLLLAPDDWKWTGFTSAEKFLHVGDIIYVHLTADDGTVLHGELAEDSGVEAALLAIDNSTGGVLAMVGGRDFNLSQFNRATQAERQTGSSFKPYVYTAAVEDGITPQDHILDTPVSWGSYVPHNYDHRFEGSITIEHAFADSRNIPALKLAARVGIHNVIALAHKFGVTSNIPPFLPIALGAVEISLEQQVSAYSVFPNDGVRIAPHLIRKVTDAQGIPLLQTEPQVSEVITAKTARTMIAMFKDVIAHGTGENVAALHHALGGKTGTTNNYTDAWFVGFSPSTTCGVWVGYDDRESLGKGETGAHAALPIWTEFMKAAITGKPDETFPGDAFPLPDSMKGSTIQIQPHSAASHP
ncbi:MAG TPA: penicillin-binding protein [Acidobacterium sp.]|nr:penicillin-binding protein [Acidobacterium sp.]